MKIVASRCMDLPAEEWQRLEEIAEGEFGEYALVRETEWAKPDWSYRVFEGDVLAAFYNIVLRTVQVDGKELRVAGLNNVITLAAFRGKGIASRALREGQSQWVEELGVDCGLLLCADALLPFYTKLDWRRLVARVTYAQSAGETEWVASCMVLDPGRLVGAARTVDLRGLPW